MESQTVNTSADHDKEMYDTIAAIKLTIKHAYQCSVTTKYLDESYFETMFSDNVRSKKLSNNGKYKKKCANDRKEIKDYTPIEGQLVVIKFNLCVSPDEDDLSAEQISEHFQLTKPVEGSSFSLPYRVVTFKPLMKKVTTEYGYFKLPGYIEPSSEPSSEPQYKEGEEGEDKWLDNTEKRVFIKGQDDPKDFINRITHTKSTVAIESGKVGSKVVIKILEKDLFDHKGNLSWIFYCLDHYALGNK